MQLRLLQTRDAAKQVFNAAGQTGHTVSFELAHRYDYICLTHRVDQIKFGAEFSLLYRDSAAAGVEIEDGTGLVGGLLHSTGGVDGAQLGGIIQSARRVGDDNLGRMGALDLFNDGAHHLRMGGGRFLGTAAHQQVWLYQHLFSAKQGRVDAKLLPQPLDRSVDGLRLVVLRFHHHNRCIFIFFLRS